MQLGDQGQYESFPQPEWNGPRSVEQSLAKVSRASDRAEAEVAHEQLLSTVGNNHAGTYYPIVLAVVPVLGIELEYGAPWAQFAAVESLLDLLGSFEPEPGFQVFKLAPMVEPQPVSAQLRIAIESLLPSIRKLAAACRPASASGAELLSLLHDVA